MKSLMPSSRCNPFLIGCHSCNLVNKMPSASPPAKANCPRCGASLHHRKPNSIGRTWAFLIAAYIFYLPANIMPIMTTVSYGSTRSDTIISGVIYLAQSGFWPLALIVFVASVFVPIMKLAIFSGLLLSIQRRSRWRPVDRTRLYRITEVVGRWSMVDIYVVTILVALVKLGSLATVKAGAGAVFFAAVVVLTMLAASAFDPRLIWDAMERDNG